MIEESVNNLYNLLENVRFLCYRSQYTNDYTLAVKEAFKIVYKELDSNKDINDCWMCYKENANNRFIKNKFDINDSLNMNKILQKIQDITNIESNTIKQLNHLKKIWHYDEIIENLNRHND